MEAAVYTNGERLFLVNSKLSTNVYQPVSPVTAPTTEPYLYLFYEVTGESVTQRRVFQSEEAALDYAKTSSIKFPKITELLAVVSGVMWWIVGHDKVEITSAEEARKKIYEGLVYELSPIQKQILLDGLTAENERLPFVTK